MPPISWTVAADHPAFAGHFPGQPLLPGVLLLAQVLEAVLADAALADRLGPAPRIESAKFLSPVRPGDTLDITLQADGPRLRFELTCGARRVGSGQFGVDRPHLDPLPQAGEGARVPPSPTGGRGSGVKRVFRAACGEPAKRRRLASRRAHCK